MDSNTRSQLLYLLILASSVAAVTKTQRFVDASSLTKTKDGIYKLGNPIVPSASGVDVAGAIFLMDHVIDTTGVVFAFSAYFRSSSPVGFQIWRPSGSRKDRFQVVWQMSVIPSVVYAKEDVYIESKLSSPCAAVYPGDRLGVFFQASPGAIAYRFDPAAPTSFGYISKDRTKPIRTGDTITFGKLVFPYTFSVNVYVNTKVTIRRGSQRTSCPRGVQIPASLVENVTAAPTLSGHKGDTGATGLEGPKGPRGHDGSRGPMGTMGMPGLQGIRGVQGRDGATGRIGPLGLTGATGPWGHTGATGPRGERGPAGSPGMTADVDMAAVSQTQSQGFLTSPGMSVTSLVWLAAVTILLCIVVIYLLLTSWRSSMPSPHNYNISNDLLQKYIDEDSFVSWLDSLKEDDCVKDVKLETISEEKVHELPPNVKDIKAELCH